MLAGTLAFTGSAEAKVTSIAIKSFWDWGQGRYASRDSGSVSLVIAPLTMESVHGNPLIQIHMYRADGRTTDPSKFTKVRTLFRHYLTYDMLHGEERELKLDEVGFYFDLDSMLRDLRGESYSFYVTADDGDGETSPSNVLTLELTPLPSTALSVPVIEEITSPVIGMAVIRLSPMRFLGDGLPAIWFTVHYADGATTNPSDFRTVMIGGSTWNKIDSTLEGIGDVRQIVVAGLKSGETSFFVSVKTEPADGVEAVPSNIMTANVHGARTIDDPLVTVVHIRLPSGVSDASDQWKGMGPRLW
jgi:hypothetical protein